MNQYGVETVVLDFDRQEWVHFDYSSVDFLVYYPSFKYSSSHPLALHEVYDNLMYIHEFFPNLKMYPDPAIIKYYNDKYRQFLFLSRRGYPIPSTIPLFSEESIDEAEKAIGYPMVIKNRYGAGGGTVFKAVNRREVMKYYRMSRMDIFHFDALKHFGRMVSKRIYYYWLIKARNAQYPFFSPPILAQKFLQIDRDLKTVTGDYKVVEAHWRLQADASMWKMNIDGGGTGVWSKVPQEALDLSVRLARDLQTSWLNIDFIESDGKFLISEFSPVWHHYAYKEKPSFVYADDYNIDLPLEVSLDLERIIVESLIAAVNRAKQPASAR